ncbi:MAG: hypothetical protein H7Z14_18410 [Anaerolineae bacterium]|nr:hypothetical protein [Phycisphaerae bacterium]
MKEQVTISMLSYAPPELDRSHRRLRALAAAFIVLHPFMFHVGVLVTWLCAWTSLGRPPRPSLDDPAMIGGFVRVPYAISALPLVLWPVVAFLAVLMMVILFTRYRALSRLSASMGVAYVLAFVLLRWDPGNLVCWYMD